MFRKPQQKTSFELSPVILVAFGLFAGVLILLFVADVGTDLVPCVGVIEVNGEISMDRIEGGLFSSAIPNAEDIAAAIEAASKKQNVKAILVRINSPGGSVVASRLIRLAIDESDVPTVSYLSEMAASGGYYIASGTDYIVSDPNTITGSVGVIAIFADARELLEKIGVNITAVTSGKYKSMGSYFEGLDEEDRAIIESIINETYQEFFQVVIDGRGNRLDKEAFAEVADGRILSGRQALKIGMVDELGTNADALRKAASLGGIEMGDPENPEPAICRINVQTGGTGGFGGMQALQRAINLFSTGVQLR